MKTKTDLALFEWTWENAFDNTEEFCLNANLWNIQYEGILMQ